ncbi:small ribosomal subunit protein bS16m [Neodiprion pinetum]|uniref:Small ribosomal subunit protein bS16m n=1 Tax=Neodiprion lecontei TaxID=441921 RepID=A0A6J0C112_NEOLC|nr:probable 28S ribosomal protein S16, mitochondrial [Neodiprion lecontei]XP_046480964.1 probable 28S ribosomal protein S16, mitochondrial [Neodiprion pinetum]
MPKMPWHPASGTGIVTAENAKKVIRLARYGCTNRPFFHIVVMESFKEVRAPPIEQVGTFDEVVNERNEKLVSLNFERIQYWIANGAQMSKPVAELLGLSGFFPIHPRSYMLAWRNRQAADAEAAAAAAAAATAESAKQETEAKDS